MSTPPDMARVIAALVAWAIPKSSALTINKRVSSGYPSQLLAVVGAFIVCRPRHRSSAAYHTRCALMLAACAGGAARPTFAGAHR
ncbi:MAG: hypothetical protein WA009_01115 [Phototrophicaceae bacterium]